MNASERRPSALPAFPASPELPNLPDFAATATSAVPAKSAECDAPGASAKSDESAESALSDAPGAIPNPTIVAAKRALRAEIKARLRSLDVDRTVAAFGIWASLRRDAVFAAARVLAVYLDFGTEAPIRPFLPSLFADASESEPSAPSEPFQRFEPSSKPLKRLEPSSKPLERLAPSSKPLKRFEPSTSTTPRPRIVAVPYCAGPAELRFYRLAPPIAASTDVPTADALAQSTAVPADDSPARPTAEASVFADLAPGSFGILEPVAAVRDDESRLVAPEAFDVVLVPGLAFDRAGRRLGRGAGYYDRFLARVSPSARLIGVAFDEQLVDAVPVDAFDRRVDAIATPTRLIVPTSRA